MRPVQTGLLAACLVGVLAIGASLRADEEKLPLDKLPKAVMAAVKKRFPDATLKEAAKEVEEGKTLYEVSLEDKGQKIDVVLKPDGQIEVIEKTIAAKDLPKAVTATLEAKYPKATYKKLEELIEVKDGKEKLTTYEVLLVTAAKKTLEVLLAPDGKVTKEEDKSKKKD